MRQIALLLLVMATALSAPNQSNANERTSAIKRLRPKLDVNGLPSCTSHGNDYRLSEDKKWCVKQCPEYEHYSSETKKCEGCPAGYMSDSAGNCHVGI